MMVIVMLVMVMSAHGAFLFLHKLVEQIVKRFSLFKSGDYSIYIEIGDRRCNYLRCCVMRSYKRYRLGNLCVTCFIGVTEIDTARMLNLIVKELTEILHIHLTFINVNDNDRTVNHSILNISLENCLCNVAELSDTRGLYENSVGIVGRYDLAERLTEVTDERAADAARIHFGYLNARFLKKAAVNTDLTKFVFNENKLFSLIRVAYQAVDKGSFSCSQKARNYIYFRHFKYLFSVFFIL